ncbi:MAG: hypothetical protein NTX29_15045, partial [Actinobacteria bacterium]|nr:hypothetical protein [Actinomycetota bacterium]
KKPIMLLLKQARAFGVGVVLSTQNPVDVDYKALSNAGTWLIGRLQTEQDKARLVDGLKSAAGGVDIGALSETISGLGKRQFLLKRVGSDKPTLTTTRWAMSYLRGPLMRNEITRLAETGLVAGPAPAIAPPVPMLDDTAPTPAPTEPRTHADDETPVAPNVATGIAVSYLDPAAPWAAAVGAGSGPRVEAAAIARIRLRYDDTKAALVHDVEYEAVLLPLTPVPRAVDFVAVDYDDRDLLDSPAGPVTYALPNAEISRKTWWTALQKSLTEHLVSTRPVEILANPELKIYSRIGETPEEFAIRCHQAADTKADAAIAALQKKYETKLRALRTRSDTATGAAAREAGRHEVEYGAGAQVANLLGGLFGGARSRKSIVTDVRRASASSARVDAAAQKAGQAQQAISDIEVELAAEVANLDALWSEKAANVQPMQIPLTKSDVVVADLRLVWIPTGS